MSKRYNRVLDRVCILFFMIFIFIAQYNKGLYFRNNYMIFLSTTGFIFLFYCYINFTKKGFKFIINKMDIMIIFFAAIYFITYIFGICKMDSLDGVLRILAVFMIFKISYSLSSKEEEDYLLYFSLIGYGVAFTSLLGAVNILNMEGIYGFGKRLAGSYQYANTFAAVLGAFFIYNILLMIYEKNKFIKIYYALSEITIMIAFISSKSRGAGIVFILVYFFQLILLNNRDRLRNIVYSFIIFIISFGAYWVFNGISLKLYFVAFYFIIVILSVFTGIMFLYIDKVISNLSISKMNFIQWTSIALIVLLGVSCLFVKKPLELSNNIKSARYDIYGIEKNKAYSLDINAKVLDDKLKVSIYGYDKFNKRHDIIRENLGRNIDNRILFKSSDSIDYISICFENLSLNKAIIYRCSLNNESLKKKVKDISLSYAMLPFDISQKLSSISLKGGTASERLTFYKDGLKIIKDSPLIGYGYNSWSKLYTQYQSYDYKTKNPHNFYIQTAIETGVLGLSILFGIIYLTSKISVFLLKQKNENNYMKILSITVFLAFIFIHAFIDVDFTYFSIWCLCFLLIGYLCFNYDKERKYEFKYDKYSRIAIVVISLIFTVVTFLFNSGIRDGEYASSIFESNPQVSAKYYESAMKKDFYNVSYIMDYAHLSAEFAASNQDENVFKKIDSYYKKAIKLDRNNTDIYLDVSDFYMEKGKYDECIYNLDKAIDINPLQPLNYERKAVYVNLFMEKALKERDYKSLEKFKNEMVNIDKVYKNKISHNSFKFNLTPKTIDIIKKSQKNNI